MVNTTKGFIGPIGDDLPSLIAILMALSLFFSGLTYSLDAFGAKQRNVQFLRGSIDSSRALLRWGVFPATGDELREGNSPYYSEAERIAYESGLGFYACYNNTEDCSTCFEHDSNIYSYLIARYNEGNGEQVVLDTLRVCTWRAET